MVRLNVRNVDEDVVAALKVRAKLSGRSAAAEHRLILEEALRHDRAEIRPDADLNREDP